MDGPYRTPGREGVSLVDELRRTVKDYQAGIVAHTRLIIPDVLTLTKKLAREGRTQISMEKIYDVAKGSDLDYATLEQALVAEGLTPVTGYYGRGFSWE